ncbi:MAG: TauD/TfdA family dioxygenase, partial [Gammaproteobacteria bacterium]|nr:TauD/TfdA family dioxygenase [Gammaproteobacteria bacterium]
MNSSSSLTINALQAPLGACVEGLERDADWSAEQAESVARALLERKVLVFPGATMDPAQTLAFARRFGDPIAELNRDKRHGELPEVSVLNSTLKAVRDAGSAQDDSLEFHHQPVIRASDWHTDQSFMERPARATVLHAHQVPSRGGATWFCDTAAAYAALPESMKARLAGLKAVHGYDTRRARYRPATRSQAEVDESPDVTHPLVRTHPESGEKALYLNFNRLDHIVDLPRAESDALLDELAKWVVQERFVYKHRWQVGDAVVWDNRCTM